MALNLEKQLQFYSAYHHHPVNIAIHIICVPLLLVTAILLITNTPAVIATPQILQAANLPLNLGTLVGVLYSTLYVLMEPVAGGMLAPLLLGATAYSNHLTSTYGSAANYWATGVHVACWLAQFVGHGVFEGRAPALLDNLVQALFLAPFFVWMEILFYLGYRPELQARVESAVEKDIAAYRQSKIKAAGGANGKADEH